MGMGNIWIMKLSHLCALALTLVASACGSGDKDWTQRPLKTVTGTTKEVAFSIELPDGMEKQDDGGMVRFDFHIDGRHKTPEISVGTADYAPTLDDYLKTEPGVTNWIRKDTLPDGYIVSYENSSYKGREDYLVFARRAIGGKTLTCNARVTPWTKGATTKDKLPALEKICLSLKPS
jgi:hypothetical protein